VIRLALNELVSRKNTTGLAALGLLIATTGFVTLLGTSQTTSARLSADITRSWQTPYDLLVRPALSVTELEREAGLVRPNYASGIAGGITVAQLQKIRHVPGVAIAAPVAIIGLVNWEIEGVGTGPLREPAGRGLKVYRSVITASADAGLSSAPVETHYTVVASIGELRIDPQTLSGRLMAAGTVTLCSYPVNCWAPSQCFGTHCGPAEDPPSYGIEMLQPMVVAGIDPQAEARLVGLDHCIGEGRYLTQTDTITPAVNREPPGTAIPVLVSTHSFIDETYHLDLAESDDPAILQGRSPADLGGWRPVSRQSVTVDDLYRRYLPRLGQEVDEWPVWTLGQVDYVNAGLNRLRPSVRNPEASIYNRNYQVAGFPAGLLIPPTARDRWFRTVGSHGFDGEQGLRYWRPVGRYNPSCLPGFDRLAGGALETYSVPEVRLFDGRRLRPNRSPGAYLNLPPLILTTLAGAAWFADPSRFRDGPGDAFISVVRIRVDGVASPSKAAEAQLARVAAAIKGATGLKVDVVKGSSQRDVAIDLVPGTFGRPELQLTEGWWLKGVAIRFVRAVSIQNVALASLSLLAAAVLVGQTAYIAARRRRHEFGTLRAIGWPAWRIAQLVETEVLLLGLVVGTVGLFLGLALLGWFHASLSGPPVWFAIPASVLVALMAGIVPAIAASRGTTVKVMRGEGTIRRRRPAGSVMGLALRQLFSEWRLESLLGVGAVALGASVIGLVVLVVLAFQGQLDTTLLGLDLSGKVRPFHAAIAVLTVLIGGLTAGEVMALAYLERRPHFATLRALGWRQAHVTLVLATQGVGIGLMGGLLGALVVVVGGTLLRASTASISQAMTASIVGALIATLLGIAGPLAYVMASRPGSVLRGE
jgi:putative ABC transport system permease protein